MFDSMIAEADEQFNLNGKAGTLLSSLLALITNGTRGGLAGFLEEFNRAGLDDATDSWIDTGKNVEISKEQLESVFGADPLKDVANQTGIDYNAATSALAFMTPRVIDALTSDGVLPKDDNLISKIGSYLNEVDDATDLTAETTFDRIGTAAVSTSNAEKPNVGNANLFDKKSADDSFNNINSPFGWILPLVLLGLLLTLGYWFCSKSPEPILPTNTNINNANQ